METIYLVWLIKSILDLRTLHVDITVWEWERLRELAILRDFYRDVNKAIEIEISLICFLEGCLIIWSAYIEGVMLLAVIGLIIRWQSAAAEIEYVKEMQEVLKEGSYEEYIETSKNQKNYWLSLSDITVKLYFAIIFLN